MNDQHNDCFHQTYALCV